MLSYFNKSAIVGSKIKVNNKQYTLVGILDDNVASQMNGNGVILSKSNNIQVKSDVTCRN